MASANLTWFGRSWARTTEWKWPPCPVAVTRKLVMLPTCARSCVSLLLCHGVRSWCDHSGLFASHLYRPSPSPRPQRNCMFFLILPQEFKALLCGGLLLLEGWPDPFDSLRFGALSFEWNACLPARPPRLPELSLSSVKALKAELFPIFWAPC